jgi:hypothetical protein
MTPTGDLPEVFAAGIIFWILLPFVLIAPIRWAVLAWLIMGNLDTTGPGQSALVSVGWINAAKGILLPAYLWWRLRQTPSEAWRTIPVRLWLALTAYASLAILWAPFQLAGAKLVGNMVGTLITIIMLEKAARSGLLGTRGLVVLTIASLILGSIQTYYFGGAVYGFDGTDQPSRLSSFVAAQQYAALLVALLTAALWDRGLRGAPRPAICLLLCIALVLNGSRIWCIGALIVLLVYFWLSWREIALFAVFGAAAGALGALFIVNLNVSGFDPDEETSSRIVATASAVLTGQDTAHNAGLRNLGFRLAIYGDVFNELKSARASQILFGNGTSSGGLVLMRVFPYMVSFDRLDPNRAIHNEWLRALYEWGIVGLALLLSVFGTLLAGLIARFRNPVWRTRSVVVLAFLPSFLGALSTENILAGTGNAVTVGFAILLALHWAPEPSWRLRRDYHRPAAA